MPLQARPSVCAAFSTLLFVPLAVGCGTDHQQISAERREAAESARQSERIKQLERDLREQKHSSRVDRTPAAEQMPIPTTPPRSSDATHLVPDSGSYEGMARQRGARSAISKNYNVTMVFSSGGSFVNYPSLGCEGRLVPDGFDGDRRVYRERITSGHCDRNGTWKITVKSPDALSAEWTLSSQDYIVVAELSRA